MFVSNKKSGFTLIELLVSIAIIGVLSTIVLTSVSGAKNKAGNAGVKANLSGLRSSADIIYSDNNQSYAGVCADLKVIDVINSAIRNGGDTGTVATRCNSTTDAWAVNVLLKVPEATYNYWCVDNSGASRGEASELSGATACL